MPNRSPTRRLALLQYFHLRQALPSRPVASPQFASSPTTQFCSSRPARLLFVLVYLICRPWYSHSLEFLGRCRPTRLRPRSGRFPFSFLPSPSSAHAANPRRLARFSSSSPFSGMWKICEAAVLTRWIHTDRTQRDDLAHGDHAISREQHRRRRRTSTNMCLCSSLATTTIARIVRILFSHISTRLQHYPSCLVRRANTNRTPHHPFSRRTQHRFPPSPAPLPYPGAPVCSPPLATLARRLRRRLAASPLQHSAGYQAPTLPSLPPVRARTSSHPGCDTHQTPTFQRAPWFRRYLYPAPPLPMGDSPRTRHYSSHLRARATASAQSDSSAAATACGDGARVHPESGRGFHLLGLLLASHSNFRIRRPLPTTFPVTTVKFISAAPYIIVAFIPDRASIQLGASGTPRLATITRGVIARELDPSLRPPLPGLCPWAIIHELNHLLDHSHSPWLLFQIGVYAQMRRLSRHVALVSTCNERNGSKIHAPGIRSATRVRIRYPAQIFSTPAFSVGRPAPLEKI
ncbi:hypothetical protein B0H13DRAFT_1868280 [Mycena leptocephala]|nr:hypothetical protein B0H13DRAFT_1868280 [Mycena leptocephala]